MIQSEDMMYGSPARPDRKLVGIDAKVIEHTVTIRGEELITFVVQAPKFLDAEVEKHRMISSNSSSDRAIPVKNMIAADYWLPSDLRLNEKGMQGYTKADSRLLEDFRAKVTRLRTITCWMIEDFPDVHKQHLNRYLLPYSYQTKIMTMNKQWFTYFIGLRKHEHADPAIQELAAKMEIAYNWSQPRVLEYVHQWHLPFVTLEEYTEFELHEVLAMSVARCARVSYNNHDGTTNNIDKDKALFKILYDATHRTPMEHQAKPMTSTWQDSDSSDWEEGVTHMDKYGRLHSGNFTGYIQYRQLL